MRERTIDAEREVVCSPFHGIGQVGIGNLRCIGEPAGDPLQVVVEAGSLATAPSGVEADEGVVDPFLQFVMVHAEHVGGLPEALFICSSIRSTCSTGGSVAAGLIGRGVPMLVPVRERTSSGGARCAPSDAHPRLRPRGLPRWRR